ncbi:MAG TPA: type II toxin-antitoxin system RelE/ParE family toxin [Gemmatimonadaceae bacterium]
MARYRVLVKPSAAKDIEKVPVEQRRRIATRILSLAENPRPYGCEKLTGDDLFRIRQGDYRVVYSIEDEVHVVRVLRVGHRRDVYR